MSEFWLKSADSLFKELGSRPEGLTSAQAMEGLRRWGHNTLRAHKRVSALGIFLSQFKSPLVLLLISAAILSWCLGDRTDAAIILGIVVASAVLSFIQEYNAGDAVEKLLALVKTQVTTLRDGAATDVPVDSVVPGDVVLLNAGDLIPGDGVILETENLFMDEAALTGETFPVEKRAEAPEQGDTAQIPQNAALAGAHVVSGVGKLLVVETGKRTQFGHIAQSLQMRPPETEFEHGIRSFGYLLIEFTLVLTLSVFAINVFMKRPVLDSFLFALALAVGLTPQLLPAIISVNLARGAREMARAKVIVKRLAAIENLGAMTVLCSDKTGTLTQGVVQIHGAYEPGGAEDAGVLRLARLNAALQTGFTNPIDHALLDSAPPDLNSGVALLGEAPYDFTRKRLSVLVQDSDGIMLITKGALEPVLAVCKQARGSGGAPEPLELHRDRLMSQFETYSHDGLRVLGVATKTLQERPPKLAPEEEADMIFAGFLVLEDPLRADSRDTVAQLAKLGIGLKMITGDNRLVAAHVGEAAGLSTQRVLTASDLRATSDDALLHMVGEVDVFAEVDPNQKERIIRACKRAGYVVGYIGDGINDGVAIHAADVGIAVSSAADVAKEAADLVMLEPDLGVLVNGVKEGRRTFANTLKYVFMATSANFGNMFSMAGASLLLPFLPLMPSQILLLNLLTDLPEMGIAADNIDPEAVETPRRWSVAFLRRFMLIFGPVSSVFDFATFGVLLLMGASQAVFRTGWFTESLISAVLIVLVLRTRRPFYRSRPGMILASASVGVILATLLLPLTPLAHVLGLAPLPILVLGAVVVIVILYVIATEFIKQWFYRREGS